MSRRLFATGSACTTLSKTARNEGIFGDIRPVDQAVEGSAAARVSKARILSRQPRMPPLAA